MEANVPQTQSDQTQLHKPEARPSLRGRFKMSSTLCWIAIVALLVGVPTTAALLLALYQDSAPQAITTGAGAEAVEGECGAWPTQGWCTSTPEEQGMDATVLDQMMQFVDEHDMAIDVLGQLLDMEYSMALTQHNLRLDPEWDPLREHPRFQELLSEN